MTAQEHIDDVMDHFDFERVHKTMVALDWVWLRAENGIPEPWELRKAARRMLKEVWRTDSGTIATGGFRAEAMHDEDEESLTLTFEVAQWTSDDS
jgi:hypothetical protein